MRNWEATSQAKRRQRVDVQQARTCSECYSLCVKDGVVAYEGQAAGGVWGQEGDGHVALLAEARDPELHCVG